MWSTSCSAFYFCPNSSTTRKLTTLHNGSTNPHLRSILLRNSHHFRRLYRTQKNAAIWDGNRPPLPHPICSEPVPPPHDNWLHRVGPLISRPRRFAFPGPEHVAVPCNIPCSAYSGFLAHNPLGVVRRSSGSACRGRLSRHHCRVLQTNGANEDVLHDVRSRLADVSILSRILHSNDW